MTVYDLIKHLKTLSPEMDVIKRVYTAGYNNDIPLSKEDLHVEDKKFVILADEN